LGSETPFYKCGQKKKLSSVGTDKSLVIGFADSDYSLTHRTKTGGVSEPFGKNYF
jgi:hypothetical protein